MPDRVPLPWVLLRHGAPVVRFDSRERAQRFWDGLRRNRLQESDAALFGPDGEAWYCPRWRTAEWVRDDDRRKREKRGEDAAA